MTLKPTRPNLDPIPPREWIPIVGIIAIVVWLIIERIRSPY